MSETFIFDVYAVAVGPQIALSKRVDWQPERLGLELVNKI